MQVKSEQLVNIALRLDKLRSALGLNWQELAALLDISRVMLHYIRKGEKPIGVKLDYRIRQAEERAGLLNIPPPRSGGLKASCSSLPEKWMQTLGRRWKQKKAYRNEMTLAIRVLFPDQADEILFWLKKI